MNSEKFLFFSTLVCLLLIGPILCLQCQTGIKVEATGFTAFSNQALVTCLNPNQQCHRFDVVVDAGFGVSCQFSKVCIYNTICRRWRSKVKTLRAQDFGAHQHTLQYLKYEIYTRKTYNCVNF